MSIAATAERVVANAMGESRLGGEPAQTAWSRNLHAGVQTAQALHAEHAAFAAGLLDLNLRAAGALSRPTAPANPFDLGASAVELYLGYLGRCAAVSQQAIVLPWKEGRR